MIKIFVYKLDDNNADILLDKMSLLSLKEKEYVCRYKYEKDRLRSLLGRLLLLRFADVYEDESFKEINFISDPNEFTKDKLSDIKIAVRLIPHSTTYSLYLLHISQKISHTFFCFSSLNDKVA